MHAFTHWMSIYTGNDLILCDLQGIKENASSWVLIDPQMHTSQSDCHRRKYWDKGPQGIQQFIAHHLKTCNENSFSYGLNLKELQYVVDRPKTPPGKKHHSAPGPHSPENNRKKNRGSLNDILDLSE
ncbi:unnamed protein product [Mycena citricolor]|uniref:Alpha-type protein kinase domain-containing protein n=1 Tax=Mycena citricolor TaxID=2018698 RepID=A0AAD2Q0S7_9AGAR|nr:unnamed protein product [Mycena citricolor]